MGSRNILIMIDILFFIPTLDKGGAENVLINLVNNLDHRKFNITVQTLFDQNSQKEKLKPYISYKSFLKKQFNGNSRLFARLPSTILYRLIVKNEYDIVVSYLEGPTTYILSGCPYIKTKKVAWIHTAFENERGFYAGFTSKQKAMKAYRSYDMIVFVAKMALERFNHISGKILAPEVVLYNTIESEMIKKYSDEDINDFVFNKDEIKLISVGKIQPVKGFDRLARIHKKLIDDGFSIHTYIIGSGDQQDEIDKYIKENRIDDTFTFLGFKDNPYKYVAKADLFVCSSRREGFSTAVTESLIVGTPVISTNCSGIYEQLGERNEYGVVTDNNVDSLYTGLYRLLTSPNLLSHYRNQAKIRAKMFSKEKTVTAVEDMLLNL